MGLKINGVEIVAPSKFEYSLQDLDTENSIRTADGRMHRDRIRQVVKINLEWGPLSAQQLLQLLQSVDSVSFNVSFTDPKTNTEVSKAMYVGDRKTGLLNYSTMMYTGTQFNLIEM